MRGVIDTIKKKKLFEYCSRCGGTGLFGMVVCPICKGQKIVLKRKDIKP